MSPTLSVVIPALNEAAAMPSLLAQLGSQTLQPDEVIVADAGSTDGTRDVAVAGGARVVDGGKPAEGRNAGARVASGELILFIDADVDLDDTTIESLVTEFQSRDLVAGTAHIEPLERNAENLFACEVANVYLDLMQFISPHAPGFCILTRRWVHEQIEGFDESLLLAEDHDYVQRAARLGKFRVLQDVAVRTSMRRIEKEGLLTLAFKYMYCEVFVVAGRPVTHVPFEYEFAAFEGEQEGGRFSAEALRERVGEAARALAAMPVEAIETLAELADADGSLGEIDRLLGELPAADLSRISRYLKARARLARMRRGAVLSRFRAAGDRVWTELTQSVR